MCDGRIEKYAGVNYFIHTIAFGGIVPINAIIASRW